MTIERDVTLTDSLEIHFINMVKYRKVREKPDDPLIRWLAWFDRGSEPELIEEVVKMDNAIQTADERLLYVTGDEDAQRAYLVRFRAMCDLASMQNASHRKGREEGFAQGREEGISEGLAQGREEGVLATARNALAQGLSAEMVQKITGLSLDTINQLT
jgi:predicted transposase/invertase (TIGR01784 family)